MKRNPTQGGIHSTKVFRKKDAFLHNVKKVIACTFLASIPFTFGGCEKDSDKQERDNDKPKTYTYIYDENGIPMDTLMAYTNIDTFYVVPKTYDLFATVSENGIHNVKNHLDNCTRHNPKTHGKGKFRAKYASLTDSTWLANFGYEMSR